ncbi:hypothetical protein IGI04_023629 [Brassica rapa subsp. trilocularis]|uniref:Uncharacterized protein n=1 Tax=Brassica rapa subsp. trilocularis TaxID=1813537 RepID=A0ABQ7M8L0_BRACM|nr:hypothetical protein IGI04_023629 [Brassica rapa subsp. trilocularis]
MFILQKSGLSVSREEAAEDMKECRLTLIPWCQTTLMREDGPSLFPYRHGPIIEVLILEADKNGVLRDKEGRAQNKYGQLINAHGAAIPEATVVVVNAGAERQRHLETTTVLKIPLPPYDDQHTRTKYLDTHLMISIALHGWKNSHVAYLSLNHLRRECTKEADGFHKGLKSIHDHVKIVVSNSVSKVELPIPPDRSVHLGPKLGYLMTLCTQYLLKKD